MDYEKLKEVIAKKIKENGRGEITGPVLQAVLMAMVDSLCEVYPHTYTDEQKAQARANIDALSNHNGEITEPKLDADLTAKVNNNVKTVAQTLSDDEVQTASKNLKFRDDNGNFFADKASYDAVLKLHVSEKPDHSILGNNCTGNTFGHSCSHYILGNNCTGNTFGDGCKSNILGNNCTGNTFGDGCKSNILGNNCIDITFGENFQNFKIDTGVSHIIINGNSSYGNYLENIHILSGVHGESYRKLVINIPDEYRNSSRELIITTKRTDGGPSTPEDLVMYYADEVVDKQNKQDNTLATTSKEVVGAINELFNGGVKKTDLSALTDTEVNNIWDNN